MSDQLFVNADWSALVPAGSPDARFGIQAKDAKRLGLLPSDGDETPAPTVIRTANLIEDPKEAPKPPNKARRKPPTK